jgi:hypothetical protein
VTRKPTPKKLTPKQLQSLDAILAKAREQAKADPSPEKIAAHVRALITHPNPKPPCATS